VRRAGPAATGLVRACVLRRVACFGQACGHQRAAPRGQTRSFLIAVGLGAFLILRRQGARAQPAQRVLDRGLQRSDCFIDVQPDQAEPLARFLEVPDCSAGETPAGAPGTGDGRERSRRQSRVVRRRAIERLASPVNTWTFRDASSRTRRLSTASSGRLARPPTPRCRLSGASATDSGSHWRPDTVRHPRRVIEARVTSVRESSGLTRVRAASCSSSAPGARPGAAYLHRRSREARDAAERARLQRAAVDRFPNVSIIDAREIARPWRRCWATSRWRSLWLVQSRSSAGR